MITDAGLQRALRDAKKGKPVVFLTDPAPRGAGRLVAKVQASGVEWYARRVTGGKRTLHKLGAWPAMSVLAARAAFAGAPAPGGKLQVATFGDLVDGYLASLEGRPSAWQAAELLNKAAAVIGRGKQASEVTPPDVVAVLRPIYDRKAPVQADKIRTYLNAAFRWGMQAEHDYTVAVPRRWGLASNPVAAVPRDQGAERVGERWLTAKELAALLRWAMGGSTKTRKAVALIAMTGQRVHEIIDLRAENWDSAERLLQWERTKNGRPHTVPVCKQAAAILDTLRPGRGGWLFPNNMTDRLPMPDGSVLGALRKYAARNGMERFTGRDLRRTWKTLAGEAGLTKAERDWLQNHTRSGDVSSKHYDRWDAMPEKRAAVARWEAWLSEQLRDGKAKPEAR